MYLKSNVRSINWRKKHATVHRFNVPRSSECRGGGEEMSEKYGRRIKIPQLWLNVLSFFLAKVFHFEWQLILCFLALIQLSSTSGCAPTRRPWVGSGSEFGVPPPPLSHAGFGSPWNGDTIQTPSDWYVFTARRCLKIRIPRLPRQVTLTVATPNILHSRKHFIISVWCESRQSPDCVWSCNKSASSPLAVSLLVPVFWLIKKLASDTVNFSLTLLLGVRLCNLLWGLTNLLPAV